MTTVTSISVHTLKTMIDNSETFTLLDVREPEEFEICHIKGSILVPLSEIEEHLPDFDTEKNYVVHCKSGQRSLKAIQTMKDMGFTSMKNLNGGIMDWATSIEPTMEKY